MRNSKRISMLLVAGILLFNSTAPVNGFTGESKGKNSFDIEAEQKNSTVTNKKVLNKKNGEKEKISSVGNLMVLTGDNQEKIVNSSDIYGNNATFQFTIEEGYQIEDVLVADKIYTYEIQYQENTEQKQKTYQFKLPKNFISDVISSETTMDTYDIIIKTRKMEKEEGETSGEAISTKEDAMQEEIETTREFTKLQFEFTTPKLKIASTAENKWTDQNVVISLENEENNAKAKTDFYVKASETSQWVKLEGKSYTIAKNENKEYQFKAQYDVVGGELLDQGTSSVKIDKEIPQIEVKQNIFGWSDTDVSFQLSNKNKKNLSPLTYYVSEDDGVTWSKIKELDNDEIFKYIVKKESNEGKYRFKVVSAVGEDAEIYKGQEKFYISPKYKVFIDKTAPKTPVIKINNQSISTASKKWFNTSPQVTIADNQDGGSVVTNYYYLYKEGEGKGKQKNYGIDPMKFKDSGNYILEVFSKDQAGNRTEHVVTTIKFDNKKPGKPVITFTGKEGEPITFVNYKKYQLFSNEPVIATIQATDNFSGVSYITYKSVGNQTIKEMRRYGNAVSFAIPPVFIGTIQAYAEDEAGNISDVVENKRNLVVEKKKPSITINANVDNNRWQNQDVSFQVGVVDTQAGIAQIEYILNGKVVKKLDFTKTKQFVTTYNKKIKATEEAEDAKGYELKVNVVDNAGNRYSTKKRVLIDKTAPVIQISGVAERSNSNQDQTLTVAVREKIYQNNTVKISVKRKVDGKIVPYTSPKFLSDQVNAVESFAFTKEGTYEVVVQAEDKAGNKAKEQRIEFTIDKTSPVISISGVANKELNKNTVNLTIGVIESNYIENQVSIAVTKELEGKVKDYSINSWNNTGKNTTLGAKFTEDGTYTIKVTAKDKAGNNGKVQKITFTVDKTAPEITVSNVEPYQVTNKTVQFGFQVNEINYKQNGISIQAVKEDISGRKTTIDMGNIKSIKRNTNFKHTFSEEGKYTITVKAIDKVENARTKQYIFTIDNSAPVIKNLKQYNKKYLKSFKVKGTISEWIKDVTPVSYKIYLNGSEYDGISEITENGKHVLKIDAMDELNHKTSKSVEFIIDNQAPEISFHTVMDGEKIVLKDKDTIKKDAVVAVSLGDSDDFIETLSINGENKTIKKNIKQYEIPINKEGEYAIQVKANDLAGNQADQTIHITYAQSSVEATANIIDKNGEKKSENKPKTNHDATLIYICGIAACIVVGGVLYIVITGKRKGKTKE